MIKAIFFDMAGVIYQDGFKTSVADYEKKFNIPKGEFYKAVHDYQGWKDFTLGNITEKQYLEICKKYLDFDEKYFLNLMDRLTKVNWEVVKFIKELAKECLIGVISNNPKEWFEKIINKTGLKEIISVKAISSYLHVRKPDRKIFEAAINKAKVKASESIYIDDRSDRVSGAKDIGINIIIFDGDINKLKEEIKNYSK
jgi:HAD superfamily hydrolase (TIGR01509 family)